MSIRCIVSGAQTGVDRAALDAAIESNITCGGWVPKGRLDENGIIPPEYPGLIETEFSEPEVRTELNVRDSDVTLILTHGALFGGSKLTAEKASVIGKPFLHIDLNSVLIDEAIAKAVAWLKIVNPEVLNVAGPRHSDDEAIYAQAKNIVRCIIDQQKSTKTDFPYFPQADDLTLAIALRESALADCRNWDIIRWQVPYWYCTLATAGAAVAALLLDKKHEFSICFSCGALAVFGVLCIFLLLNLMRYDSSTVAKFNGMLEMLSLSSQQKVALRITRLYKFEFPDILLSASLYFIIYILGITMAFTATAVLGVWWK